MNRWKNLTFLELNPLSFPKQFPHNLSYVSACPNSMLYTLFFNYLTCYVIRSDLKRISNIRLYTSLVEMRVIYLSVNIASNNI